MMQNTLAAWIHRALLVTLLFGAYHYAWTPARSGWITHGAAPILDETLSLSGENRGMTLRPEVQTLYIETSTDTVFRYSAPAGIKFLLPGLFLLLVAPRQPRIGLFFGGHVALGILTLSLLSADMTGLTGMAQIADFIQVYGVDAYSLTLPIFVFARQMQEQPTQKSS